jgi:hypothetical protein
VKKPTELVMLSLGDRVWRDRNRLDQTLRMLPRVRAEESQPSSKRHRANAETNNSVCDMGGKLVSSAACTGGGLMGLVTFNSMRDCKNR